MSFVYAKVFELERKEKVGTKQCVALIQHLVVGIGNTSLWEEGDSVVGNFAIQPGTVIATFVNGKYPNAKSGNHAAFFLRHDMRGIHVMDQWSSDIEKPLIGARLIRIGAMNCNSKGVWPGGGNNAYAYSIVER